MSRSPNPEEFLDPNEKNMIDVAIAAAENGTSAEIKLVLVRHCWGRPEEKAANLFMKNELHKTEERNCVMIMLVLANCEFVIFGDVGINERVGQDLWDDTKDLMVGYFKNNEFGMGISQGIEKIGVKLQKFFPYKSDDKDEVSNEITYED